MTEGRSPSRPRSLSFFTWGLILPIWFSVSQKAAHDLWSATLLFAWLSILLLLFLAKSHQGAKPLTVPLLGPFCFFIVCLLSSARYSWDVNSSRLELWIWIFCGFAFYLSCNIFKDNRARALFLRWGGLIIVPLAVLCFYQRLSLPTAWWHGPVEHWAMAGTLINSAVVAGFALSWIIIGWAQRRNHPLFYIPLLSSFAILALARSWWSFVSLAIGLTYFYQPKLLSLARRRKRLLYGLAGASVLAAGGIIYYKFGPYEAVGYRTSDRWYWWSAALAMALRHPLHGIGLGAYSTALPFFKSTAGQNTLYAHSFPLQLLCETGIPGFMALLILFFAYMKNSHREGFAGSAPADLPHRAVKATVLSLLCFSLITIAMDYFLIKLMLMILMGLALAPAPFPDVLPSRKGVLLSTLGIALLVPSWNFPWIASQYHMSGMKFEEGGNGSEAMASFKKAIALNPYQDDSYAALAAVYRRQYSQSRSLLDLAQWRLSLDQALRWKKDIRYIFELNHPPHA